MNSVCMFLDPIPNDFQSVRGKGLLDLSILRRRTGRAVLKEMIQIGRLLDGIILISPFSTPRRDKLLS